MEYSLALFESATVQTGPGLSLTMTPTSRRRKISSNVIYSLSITPKIRIGLRKIRRPQVIIGDKKY
jgi:hypothetical protein